MKKILKKILLVCLIVYFCVAHTDFKKGFAAGFYKENNKPAKGKTSHLNIHDFNDFRFLAIVKMY